jgi:hypothetical protein
MAWVLRVTAANPSVSRLLMLPAKHFPADLRNPYLLVLLIVDFAAMLIALVAGRFTLMHLTGNRTFSAWGSLLLLYMSYFNLVVGYGVFMLPYDVVSLAIFSTAVWLILTKRNFALLAVFGLGTLNRETTIFIPVFQCLYTWFSSEAPYSSEENRFANWAVVGPFVVTQILLWLALRLWIRNLFVDNPLTGHMTSRWFGLHFTQNLSLLMNPPQWPLVLSVFGFALPLFVAKFDAIGNRAFSRATVVVMTLWTAVMLYEGVIIELRVFNELTAFVMPCIALIIWNEWIRPAMAYKEARIRSDSDDRIVDRI